MTENKSIPQYWVIAPYHADDPETWEKVWKFNLANGIISIGWKELGDISAYGESQLKAAIEKTYPNNKSNQTLYFNMLWNFYHNIKPGDIVIARRGTKKVAAVGTVTQPAYFSYAKNIEASGPEKAYSNHLGVRWHEAPRGKEFSTTVFGIQTIYKITEEKYKRLFEEPGETGIDLNKQANRTEFVLEKYLQEFIVSNFTAIFNGKYVLFQDTEEKAVGKEYSTDVGRIDILAIEPDTNSFVVFELKKGRETDKVVGQTLRYMGWVQENLCGDGQQVKGVIICLHPDPKLSYALKMTKNVTVKYYQVDFKLSDEPLD